MNHFKDFIIKLQTIDIKITERVASGYTESKTKKFYDISHENPFLSPSFKTEMKKLRELALTDILNLQREQIIFQLQRFSDIKDKFRRFWKNYSNSYATKYEHPTDFLFSLEAV